MKWQLASAGLSLAQLSPSLLIFFSLFHILTTWPQVCSCTMPIIYSTIFWKRRPTRTLSLNRIIWWFISDQKLQMDVVNNVGLKLKAYIAKFSNGLNVNFNPIPYGISIPAMLRLQLKTYLGVIDSNLFIHTNKTLSN